MLGEKTEQQYNLRLLGKEAGILGRCEGAGLGVKVVADQKRSPVLAAGCGKSEAEREEGAGTASGADLLKGHARQLFICVAVCDTADV